VAQNSGVSTVVAALIVGACIVAAGLLIRSSLDGATQQLADLSAAVGELQLADEPVPARPAARARPDPSRRYSIDTEGAPHKGSDGAKVTIVEFSDFQCPFCARVAPTLERIEQEFGDDVRIVFKHLPLRMHSKAPAAHAAAEAAHRQGKFWEMHDRIFENQGEMSPEKYEEYAREMGLDLERFKTDVASTEVKKKIDDDTAEASRVGVTGTPGFFINGRFLSGAQPFEAFKTLIDAELEST
jgi:protein-disulfide isomerase